MKKTYYSNYGEQVDKNINQLILFNNLGEVDEFWHEDLYELELDKLGIMDEEEYLEFLGIDELENYSDDDISEMETEAVHQMLESVYQIYMVSLPFGEYTEEHRRLGVFYNEELEHYFMPVYHYGTAWCMVGPTC